MQKPQKIFIRDGAWGLTLEAIRNVALAKGYTAAGWLLPLWLADDLWVNLPWACLQGDRAEIWPCARTIRGMFPGKCPTSQHNSTTTPVFADKRDSLSRDVILSSSKYRKSTLSLYNIWGSPTLR